MKYYFVYIFIKGYGILAVLALLLFAFFWEIKISPILKKRYGKWAADVDHTLEVDREHYQRKLAAEKAKGIEPNAAKIARIRQELEQMKRHQ